MATKINGFIEGTQSEELMKLLVSIASNWGDVFDTNKIKVHHLKGAMTNVVYRITWPQNKEGEDRTVLVRIYGEGSDIFFDREEEIRTFESISNRGHGPKLLGQFPQGRVEEFIHAKTLSACDIRDPEISTLIAAKMREFHNLNMPGSKNAVIWEKIRKFTIKAKSLCSPEHLKEFHLDILENEIDTLEKQLSQHPQNVAFCHNDLQYGNVMIDDTRTITLIDYEYASYNPVAYDIANHFCEWPADYHTDTPHVLDYSIYPDLEERRKFVHAYLSSTALLEKKSVGAGASSGPYKGSPLLVVFIGDQVRDEEVDQLIDDVEKYTLASHLFWGLWGIISDYVTNIDFDYMEYARQRFTQYWLRKPQLSKGKTVISQINDLVLEELKE